MKFQCIELSCKCKIDDEYFIESSTTDMNDLSERVYTEFRFCKEGVKEKCMIIGPMYLREDLIEDGYITLAKTSELLMSEHFFWNEILPEYFESKEDFTQFKKKHKPKRLYHRFL